MSICCISLFLKYIICVYLSIEREMDTGECSGSVSDSGARGRGFETHLRLVVSLSMTLYSTKVMVKLRKRWLHPDMTEKLLAGTLNLNTNKQTNEAIQSFSLAKSLEKYCAV